MAVVGVRNFKKILFKSNNLRDETVTYRENIIVVGKHLAQALRDLHGGRVYLQILFSLPHLKEKKCAASEKGNYSNSTSL